MIDVDLMIKKKGTVGANLLGCCCFPVHRFYWLSESSSDFKSLVSNFCGIAFRIFFRWSLTATTVNKVKRCLLAGEWTLPWSLSICWALLPVLLLQREESKRRDFLSTVTLLTKALPYLELGNLVISSFLHYNLKYKMFLVCHFLCNFTNMFNCTKAHLLSWLNLHLQWPPGARKKKHGLSLWHVSVFERCLRPFMTGLWMRWYSHVCNLHLTEQDGDANEAEDSG